MTLIHAGHVTAGATLWTHWISEPGSAIAIVSAAAIYVIGVRAAWAHAGKGRGIRRGQVVSFAAALTVLAVALISPLDAMAEELFSAHMLQHVLLAVVAPPLLVIGAPLTAGLWVLPVSARRRLVHVASHAPGVGSVWRFLTAPALAWLVHAIALWVWHAPRLYGVALRNPAAHVLEHASFVITASLMWWGILMPRQSRRSAYATGVLVMFATMLQSGALGALLALSRHVWYPEQGVGAASWGLSALEDQQIAGLIMWVPAGLLYTGAMSALFLAWMRSVPADAPAQRRGSDAGALPVPQFGPAPS
jgi:cytochrome c oxidase assembly factor CtaG